MNEVLRNTNPDREAHVILDNLKAHEPKHDRWLHRRNNVTFHYMPTHASWLNQIEIWFSILQTQSLHGATLTSVKRLRKHIDPFVGAHNETVRLFEWHNVNVRNRKPESEFSNLCE